MFSRKELLEAQPRDSFCRKVFDGLQEPGCSAQGAAGIAVSAELFESPACSSVDMDKAAAVVAAAEAA